jgi:hypothetical protein
MFFLQFSHTGLKEDSLLTLQGGHPLSKLGLVPVLKLCPQRQKLLLMSLLQELELLGVFLLGLPQKGILFCSELLHDLFTFLQKPETTLKVNTGIKCNEHTAPIPSEPRVIFFTGS